ncbi:MAG: hypothetical protein SFV18_06850 [Bryobacteraceae bacterium]|nr:hypothetical protein [Bryobacteraceae bacterium]
MNELYLALGFYALLVAALGVGLAGYLRLSREIDRLRRELARTPPPAAPAARPVRSIDVPDRERILRLDRRGEAPATIAAALGVPSNVVEFTLKVDRLKTPA